MYVMGGGDQGKIMRNITKVTQNKILTGVLFIWSGLVPQ